MARVARILLGRVLAGALLTGVAATTLAWMGSLVSPALVVSLEWSFYDRWLRTRAPLPTANEIVVFYGEGDGQGLEGGRSADRASLARQIRAIDAAGARAIGLLASIEQPSPPDRGGAQSDVLLAEAIRASGKVVVPLPAAGPEAGGSPLSLDGSLGQVGHPGHVHVVPDRDGVVRRIAPTLIRAGQAIPAFGIALATLGHSPAKEARRPVGPVRGRIRSSFGSDKPVLINDVGPDLLQAFFSVPLARLAGALDNREPALIRQWTGGKIALLLPSGEGTVYGSPRRRGISQAAIQLGLLNAALTGQWVREAPRLMGLLLALVLSAAAALAVLAFPGWKGPLGAAALGLAYAALAALALPLGHLVLPPFTPLLALVLAAGGALTWSYVRASPRVRELQQERDRISRDLSSAKDALTMQESFVEGLEEDLEEAKSTLARSVEREEALIKAAQVLQAQCDEAREREDGARRRVSELQHRLSDLQVVSAETGLGRHAEREQLHRDCERAGITTQSPKVLALFADVRKVAKSSLPVLILGEPGTGKELFARAVHQLSPRAERAFVAVNMAAITPELFESELFGHVKGSFTGAVADRKGFFEMAHTGTIFLDEIGDLPYELQGKLLRVLQERTFYRVGAAHPITVDVRVVAATNKNLQREVTAGWFRDDLYFRLQGHVLRLPPLRERLEDLPLLVRRIMQDAARETGKEGIGLSREALLVLERQPWKGNIRELQQSLRQAMALAEGKVITKEDLRLQGAEGAEPNRGPGRRDPLIDPTGDQAVLTCLREYEFDMQATARALGWDRSTVTQRLKGLGFRALVETRGDLAKAASALAGDALLSRRVEAKLRTYYEHLLRTIEPCESLDAAVETARKRFKNLPDRHFKAVQLLIQQYFERSARYHQASHV